MTLTTTAFFDRSVRKFLTKHPDLRPRITLTVQVTDNKILLLDIGSHDEVYG